MGSALADLTPGADTSLCSDAAPTLRVLKLSHGMGPAWEERDVLLLGASPVLGRPDEPRKSCRSSVWCAAGTRRGESLAMAEGRSGCAGLLCSLETTGQHALGSFSAAKDRSK